MDLSNAISEAVVNHLKDNMQTFEAEDQIIALKDELITTQTAISDICAQITAIIPVLLTGIGAAGVTGAAAATAATAGISAPLAALAADLANMTASTTILSTILPGTGDSVT